MPRTGLEPARLSTLAPETSASTIPPPGQALYDVVVICSRVGAANETRTRDPDLGKVVLYQLSYCRKMMFQPAVHHVKVIGNPLIAGAKVLLFLELAKDLGFFFEKDAFFLQKTSVHAIIEKIIGVFSQDFVCPVEMA